ncbi:MAG: HEAT repeat domain-containing protein [Gemmataceae bacterium]
MDAVKQRKDEALVQQCIERLKDPEPGRRAQAVLQLGLLGPRARRAVPALGEATDRVAQVRRLVALALGGDRAGVAGGGAGGTIRALNDPDAAIRKRALAALAEVGPDARNAVQAVTAALRADDVVLRRHAAATLGAIGPTAPGGDPALDRGAGRRRHAAAGGDDGGGWCGWGRGRCHG